MYLKISTKSFEKIRVKLIFIWKNFGIRYISNFIKDFYNFLIRTIMRI